MKRKKRVTACPCGSGASYADCCRPHHRGEEPARPGALVRARFSAFALGDGAYLYRTLHPEHVLRARPRGSVERELSLARQRLGYRSVQVRDDSSDGDADEAHALFCARVFEKGRDRSFVELSRFRRAADTPGGQPAWRYLDGDTVRPDGAAGRAQTIEAFLAARSEGEE